MALSSGHREEGEEEEDLLAGSGGPGRALEALPRRGDEGSRFAVATANRRGGNQLRILEVEEEHWRSSLVAATSIPWEMWAIAFAPDDRTVAAAAHGPEGKEKRQPASILALPEEMDGADELNISVDLHLDIDVKEGRRMCRSICFGQLSAGDFVASACERLLSWHRIKKGGAMEGFALPSADEMFRSAKCSPHSSSLIGAARGDCIAIYDTRKGGEQPAMEIADAHPLVVRDIDFAPGREDVLLSGGDDGKLRLWDTRKKGECLSELGGHSHWVWSCRFNSFHEQLACSSSTDGRVAIWSLSDSLPGEEEKPAASGEEGSDRAIRWVEEHTESVYACAWSASDPWTLASLSHDGLVAFSSVPRRERYRVLL